VRPVLFSLGPLQIHTLGFFIALGAAAGISLTVREARRLGLNEEKVLNLLLWTLLGGILGARLGYVLVYQPGYYLSHPLAVLRLDQGGLSIHGGILGGLAVALGYTRRHALPFWPLADAAAPGLILAQAIGRTGCDVFGVPMARPWPWGVMVGGTLVHPVQVYEFLLDYFLFYVLWRRRTKVSFPGQLFLSYVIGFATVRGVVEFFRANPVVYGPFTVAHVASAAFILVALVLWRYLATGRAPAAAGQPTVPQEAEAEPAWLAPVATLSLAVTSLLLFYLVR